MSEIGWDVVPRYTQPYHVGPRSEKNYTRESANEGHGLYTLSGLKNPEKSDEWGLSHIMTLRLCWGQAILKNKEYRFIEVCIERTHSKNMHTIQNKANLRNLIAVTGQVILLKLDSNRRFFSPYDLEITLNSGQNLQFFVPCDLAIWRMTLKNNRATFLYCFKLCTSFHSHQWIQSGVTVRKRPILVKIDYFFSRVILKFDGWH